MRPIRQALTLIASAAAASACAGLPAPPPAAPGRAEIARLMERYDVPGLALAVIADGRVSEVRTFGLRDIENGRPLTPETVMAGMSWTKFAFAAYVAQLAAEGRIDLDRPIEDYLPRPLPSYPHYADLAGDERWRALTLRRLLSHQSGLPNFRFFPVDGEFDRDAPLAFFRDPGTAYGYSGEGYQIAQLAVEQALGIDVAADLERRLFAGAGLERIGLVWRERFASDFDIAYAEDGRRIGHDARRSFDAAGSMNASIADFAAFVAAFVRGESVSPDARRTVLTPQTAIRSAHQFPPWSEETDAGLARIDLAAGLGVVLWTGRQGRGFFKGGHDEGGDNMLVCLIDRDACVLAMTNTPKGHLIFPQIVESALGPTDLPWAWEYAQLAATADAAGRDD